MNDRQRKEAIAILEQGAWFAGLPDALRDCILRGATVGAFAKWQFIQVENAISPGLIGVLEGQVAITRNVNDEDPALLHIAGPGYWFGEIGVLLGEPAMVTAVAQTPVRALILAKPAFDRIVADEPRHYPAFARIALERYKFMLRFMAEALRLSPDLRLRLRLADLAETKRRQTKVHGPAVDLNLSQSELASIVGMSRQKLNGRLRNLQGEGWVELAPRRIRVLDPMGLRATATQSLAS